MLVAGGAVSGVELALKEHRAGRTAFLAAPFSYFGDDICGTLDFQNNSGNPAGTRHPWNSFVNAGQIHARPTDGRQPGPVCSSDFAPRSARFLPLIQMIADVQDQGYAAGFIAAEAILTKKIRNVELPAAQKQLKAMGFLRPDVEIPSIGVES